MVVYCDTQSPRYAGSVIGVNPKLTWSSSSSIVRYRRPDPLLHVHIKLPQCLPLRFEHRAAERTFGVVWRESPRGKTYLPHLSKRVDFGLGVREISGRGGEVERYRLCIFKFLAHVSGRVGRRIGPRVANAGRMVSIRLSGRLNVRFPRGISPIFLPGGRLNSKQFPSVPLRSVQP